MKAIIVTGASAEEIAALAVGLQERAISVDTVAEELVTRLGQAAANISP